MQCELCHGTKTLWKQTVAGYVIEPCPLCNRISDKTSGVKDMVDRIDRVLEKVKV